MSKERRLGRGLEALLGRSHDAGAGDDEPSLAVASSAPTDGLHYLNVYEIEPNPYQPRREFDQAEITALAESIREHGLLQPIAVRRVEGRYQLIAGDRRLRAAIKAGWSELPAHIIEADDRQVAELAIVENLQRKDLNAIEKATSFAAYVERYGCTQEELAGRLKIDRSTVANLIRLLELPGEIQQAVRNGAITQGHARALLPLGDEREQLAFCQRIQDESLSVRNTEHLVQEMIQQADAEPLAMPAVENGSRPAARSRGEHLTSLEQELRASLGTKVDLRSGSRGRGRIVVHFTNPDEFERLYSLLREAARNQEQREAI